MKEVLSNCEKSFVLKSIESGKRLDGRGFDDFRALELNFGSDFGCCYATLGETKVLAQVSQSLSEPRALRPTEGLLFINVDISETVCSNADTGHQPHVATHANRLLEKCIKESNAVDLESLCIQAGELVFDVRVDVTVLNYDGNLLSCCSVATLGALAHFRLPAISIENSEVILHPVRERPPTPLSLHHFPILVSFAVFSDGEVAIVDPTELEERSSEGELVVGMNNYRELCGLHFNGNALGNRGLILAASSRAALIAAECVKRLRSAVEEDWRRREAERGATEGLVNCIHLDRLLSASRDRHLLALAAGGEGGLESLIRGPSSRPMDIDRTDEKKNIKMKGDGDSEEEEEEEEEEAEGSDMKRFTVRDRAGGVVVSAMETSDYSKNWSPSGGKSQWEETGGPSQADGSTGEEDGSASEPEQGDDGEEEDDVNYVGTITEEDRIIDKIELSGDSEEEEVIVLRGNEDK